jgi:spermidine synthase
VSAREVLGVGQTPDGGEVRLVQKGETLELRVDGRVLMSSAVHGSEAAMARVACEPLRDHPAPRVLIGGLGLGYTLRATLDRLPASATVVCIELLASVAEWHRGPLGPLADHPVDDPRVELRVDDVVRFIAELPEHEAFDAILLDVDNGPIPFTVWGNWWLYAAEGLAALHRAVRPNGTLIVWSTDHDERFERRMEAAGFETHVQRVSAKTGALGRRNRGDTHVLFVGRRVG